MIKSYLQFSNFKNQSSLIHGIFDKSFGNFSTKFGSSEEIEKNMKKISQELGIEKNRIISMWQVHGSRIRVIDSKSFRVLENKTISKTDGLITDQKNIFLMIKTADCYPLLFYDPVKKVVAAIHVGWRGVIEKIFLSVLLKMVNEFGCQVRDILVGIGPGINTCCFKHKKLFQTKLPEWTPYIKKEKNNILSMDLLRFIKDQLIEEGIKPKNLEVMNICTNCDSRFFSHYRSLQTGEKEGRFATIIGLIT